MFYNAASLYTFIALLLLYFTNPLHFTIAFTKSRRPFAIKPILLPFFKTDTINQTCDEIYLNK